MKPNKKHKDSVFYVLFNNPDALRELYSAIEGVPIPPDIPIDINTLTNVLIKEKLNDVSFTIDNRLVVLIEHQSLSEISDNDWYPRKYIIRVVFVKLCGVRT